jgi:methylmalonyl-CoA mutase N-terminal domain/subunit
LARAWPSTAEDLKLLFDGTISHLQHLTPLPLAVPLAMISPRLKKGADFAQSTIQNDILKESRRGTYIFPLPSMRIITFSLSAMKVPTNNTSAASYM